MLSPLFHVFLDNLINLYIKNKEFNKVDCINC